jgi:dihydrofolate synthase/folylpolyglutamate synthase
VALTAALELSRLWQPLETDQILAGLASTRWEGRLETFLLLPWIVLDGAHNREGALALRAFIEKNMPGTVVLVFATMQDKNIEVLADILFPLASRILLTRYPYSRAASPDEIARRVSSRFRERLELEPDPGRALRRAATLAGENGSVVVTGSLFLVGEVKKRFPDPDTVLA